MLDQAFPLHPKVTLFLLTSDGADPRPHSWWLSELGPKPSSSDLKVSAVLALFPSYRKNAEGKRALSLQTGMGRQLGPLSVPVHFYCYRKWQTVHADFADCPLLHGLPGALENILTHHCDCPSQLTRA